MAKVRKPSAAPCAIPMRDGYVGGLRCPRPHGGNRRIGPVTSDRRGWYVCAGCGEHFSYDGVREGLDNPSSVLRPER